MKVAILAMHELQGSKLPTLEMCNEQSSAAAVVFAPAALVLCMSPYIYAAGGERRARDCCGALTRATVPHERSVLLVSSCLESCKGKAAASSYQIIRQII